MAKEKRFNKLPKSKKVAMLMKDGFEEKDVDGMIEFLGEDIFGGPLVDAETLNILEF